MRFSIDDRDAAGESLDSHPEIYLNSIVDHARARQHAPVEFVIDTGSPKSIITPFTAQKLQIQHEPLTFTENTYMAGNTIRTASLDDATIKLKGEDGQLHTFKHDLLLAEYHGQQEHEAYNILGLDFIINCGLDLVIRRADNDFTDIYFEA